jgi:wyosine [tRNA(Phe)-imidazoG37] synthetase (radical SAM superfamily)
MKDNVLDDLLTGKHSILNGLNYTADQFIEYKKFIRNFMLDFLQLNVDEFKQKYSDKGSIDVQLKSVIGGSVE